MHPPPQPPGSPPGLDDATLVKRAQDGDLRSFEALLRRHQDAMYRVALRVLNHPDDAQDAVQEGFVTAWRQLAQFRADSAFRTWLYRIVSTRCLNMIRTQRRHPAVPLDTEAMHAVSSSAAPDQSAVADAGLRALESAITRLPAEQRLCWVLRESDQLGYAEIGQIVGATPDAVRGRIHRARETIARDLRAWQ